MLMPVLVSGCSAATPRSVAETTPVARSSDLVHLDFEGRAAPVGDIVPSVSNNGTADVGTEVVTYAGGRIVRAEGSGPGYAIRFPEHEGTLDPPAAMLLLRSRDEQDALSPGANGFAFGADVLLDDESAGPGSDNGDNIIQRGLYDDAMQYKLQLDGGVPSCRLAGADGSTLVSAEDPIARGEWHRLTCERRGDVVSLLVEPLEAAGGDVSREWLSAQVGAIDVPRTTPFVVGGKVDEDGRVVASATDQFNGVIDNVSFRLLD